MLTSEQNGAIESLSERDHKRIADAVLSRSLPGDEKGLREAFGLEPNRALEDVRAAEVRPAIRRVRAKLAELLPAWREVFRD